MIHVIKDRKDFLRAAKSRYSKASAGAIIQIYNRNDLMPVRVGFTATTKIGNAVIRNKTKRRLRAAIRFIIGQQSKYCGIDLVIIGRQNTASMPWNQLVVDLSKTLDALHARIR